MEKNLLEPNVSSLFKRCCQIDRNQKLDMLSMLKTSSAYLKHKIYSEQDLKDATDLIEQCLQWIPSNRITAVGALVHPFCCF